MDSFEHSNQEYEFDVHGQIPISILVSNFNFDVIFEMLSSFGRMEGSSIAIFMNLVIHMICDTCCNRINKSNSCSVYYNDWT